MPKELAPSPDSAAMAAKGTGPRTVVLKLTESSPSDAPEKVAESREASGPSVASLPKAALQQLPPDAATTVAEAEGDYSNRSSLVDAPSEAVAPPGTAPSELVAAAALAAATVALGDDVPAGSGPLYKCAICEALVYESQLDHHVIICPDPSESVEGPEGITEGIAEEDEELIEQDEAEAVDAEVSLPHSGTTLEPEQLPAVAQDDASQDAGRSTNSRQQKDGNAAHQVSQGSTGKSLVVRRTSMSEEVRKKEEEECTFAPKILPRGNPRTCTRSHDAGDAARWSQRSEQRLRNQRLKQVEAQVYADVTLKPKISRFAQAWSQKQHEVEGREAPTVFERLYRVAQQANVLKIERGLQEISDEATPRGAIGAQADASSATAAGGTMVVRQPQATKRALPTSELLYTDAIDRRERLKNLAEQLHSNSEEGKCEKSQVLNRSRRYYWQMLERQIKAAFEEATGNKPYLQFAVLEDFLVRFGCMRPPQQQSKETSSERAAAVQAAEEESKRLRVALWRHLDPNKVGQIDLLTLTVFFHVLMGAVDEADKASASQNLRTDAGQPQVEQEDSPPQATPTRSPPHSPRLSPGSDASVGPSIDLNGTSQMSSFDTDGQAISPEATTASVATPSPSPVCSVSGGRLLAAIFEEEGHSPREGAHHSLGASTPVDNLHAAVGDDDGRRICELLVRFDPIRLRAEFQQLYRHRLHYQPHQMNTASIDLGSRYEEVSAPEIDSQSRAMAEKVIERQRGEAEVPLSQHADLLLWRHSITEARKDERRKQASKDEVSGCTFQPKMRAKPQDMPVEVTPHGATRNEVLYARGREARERKEAKEQEASRARNSNEVKGCTFKPDTNKSSNSYHRAHDGSAPVPRGFYENKQRLRAANEVTNHKRVQREDRLSKITQVDAKEKEKMTSSTESVPVELRRPSIGEHLLHPLAPVAEGSRLQDVARRPGVKASTPRGARGVLASPRVEGGSRQAVAAAIRPTASRARSASPAGETLRSPRGDAVRRGAGGAASRSPEPQGTPREGWGTPNLRDAFLPSGGLAGAAPVVNEAPPSPTVPAQFGLASSGTSNGGNDPPATGSGAAPEGVEDESPPLLYVDVNIAPNQPPERIVLREGESVTEVAAAFAAKHVLTPALAQRLHALLREVLQRQEQRT